MKGGFGGTLPIQGSDVAGSWDSLYITLTAISVFFFLIVVGAMVFFAIKYRKGAKRKPGPVIHDNLPLEIIWTIIPTILLLLIFAWGWVVYRDMVQAPTNAYEVKVLGKQWSWTFFYPDGRSTFNKVYVPLHQDVKFTMTSDDVIHSFFIPNFRVKQDVVPGMYSHVWFRANFPGKHQLYCAEYCGTAHSAMLADIWVLEEKDWKAWERGVEPSFALAAGGGPAVQLSDMAANGKKLMEQKGCVACHSADGTQGVGPSYKGVWGSERELADGTKVTMDENYLRESLDNPQAKLVKGFGPVMPTFKGQLKEEEVMAIIEYIKSLK